MKKQISGSFLPLMFLSFTIMCGCNTIAHFDQVAYTQVTAVESDALSFMDKATEDYSVHKAEIDDVSNKIQKAYLYDKNRPKNKISEDMWKLIVDPNGHLYFGFINRWKDDGKLGATFISEEKKKVQENFDRIAQLESQKIK